MLWLIKYQLILFLWTGSAIFFLLKIFSFSDWNNPLLCFSLGVQLENEQRCQQEIEDIKHGLESGSITYDPAKLKFSEEAIEEQKHCVRIADEKVALATQTYDLVSVC